MMTPREHLNRIIQYTVNLGILVFSSLCPLTAQAIDEIKSIHHLPPMEGPDQRPIGWQWHFLDQDNQHGKMQKIAGNDLVATYARTDGCQWTRTTLGFAPASRWSNCPSSGESKVTLSDGVIWPLKVGGTFTYHIEGISSIGKNGWKSKRKCRVQGQWLIEITSGEYETFKVICKEKWSTRTWWLSPEIGTAVAYEQIDLRGRLLIQEMTRIDQESLKEKISEAN